MMFRYVWLLGASWALFGWCDAAAAVDMTGRVASIVDGETFILETTEGRHEVSLQGIDAPDPGMAYSEEAQKALSDMILGRTVRVRVARRDRGGRIEATVYLGRDNVAQRMLAGGWAWRYFGYAQRHSFSSAEDSARAARRGLWAEENPTPPWVARRQRGRATLVASKEALEKEARLMDLVDPELVLEVDLGRSKLFRAKRIVSRVSVTTSAVAEVVQFSATEFEVLGRNRGETTLTVWFVDASGEEASLRYLVRVIGR